MDLSEFLLAWRTTPLPDREVIDALVHPAHAGPSPALAAALAQWPGSYYWADEPEGRHLVLTRRVARRRRERWGLHVTLFLATLVTTTFAGAVLAGTIAYDNPFDLFTGSYPLPPHVVRAWAAGLVFSLPLLAILLCHELGHYFTARRYDLDVSPPYFIPVPLVPSFIGTMGAFIRLRTILSDRRQLFDVGVAGPIAGFVVAVPRWQRGIALVFWCIVILLGRWWWGWYLWGFLVLLLSRGRLGHPPVLDAQRPLPPSRRALAWGALVLFVITFAPVPFRI